ncbi:hypothetical protein TMatcc_006131 [Talaromyces marneffei ATCC 18224]|uniref:Uncharacterized protein n=1 Tax=Talaromyces marneffei (strain ATCC 18224 / CBS 334.59 / QM 7333) TaxID=441960 RepID=B6QCI2_TALMQ|nr:uncharacterized protein EYB26_002900 [Talaromyces marneffei]EEA25636.1 conserved hypothetical protein [Talaromyces marneffei ATCC 18224]KAE8554348.1 hypothetical protein EYB25_002887 [Talaromyces marneffei]QGA15243.1 hypothetical protein EYB26_002900 [Talaromyces marneffei]
MLLHIVSTVLFAAQAMAMPRPANTNVNPNAITNTTCTAPGVTLNSHNINVAILSICGGISGKIQQCQGQPTTTTGASGDAKLNLQVETKGTKIIITKGRWEGCMRAARAVCGDSPFSSTCIGGANDNKNNVLFQLVKQ